MSNIQLVESQDLYVQDLVEYFDDPRFLKIPEAQRMSKLSDADLAVISDEIYKMQGDFRYTAKNYFHISTKEGDSRLFQLWDGQELLLQKLEDMKRRGKPAKVCLIKARQLGMSMFGCALVAWKCMFMPNRNGMIVSEDEDQSLNLFNNYLSPIYKQLPWWLRPVNSSFALDKGIVFDKNAKEGGIGLNSKIRVQWANRKGGLGQGYRLNIFHGSEFTSWANLRESLQEDLQYALVNSAETIGILESTAKGAGTASHRFYNKCVEMAEKAEWEPFFLPYFFESTRVLAPPGGWRPSEEETRMREVVYDNWCKCSNRLCGRYFNRKNSNGLVDGLKCNVCEIGKLDPYILTDEQMYFMAAKKAGVTDDEELKSIKQELALTAEEAFISKGEQVFSAKAIENVEHYVSKASTPMKGFLDRYGYFHGFHPDDIERKCHDENCSIRHITDEHNLWIWEKPITNARYQIGSDVGYGKGKDYSVAIVNRVGSHGGADHHVATLRSNIIDPLSFAYELSKLGKFYNDAEIAIEYNSPGNSTADQLLNNLTYPNCYRRKSQDIARGNGGMYHWLTMQNTKPKLIVTMDRWLKEGIYIIRDSRFLEEIKVFTKQEDIGNKTGASSGFHDDIIMSAMIAVYTAHQGDYEDNNGIIPTKVERTPENCDYAMSCDRCMEKWGADNPKEISKCPFCQSLFVRASRNVNNRIVKPEDPANSHRDFDQEPDGWGSSWEVASVDRVDFHLF